MQWFDWQMRAKDASQVHTLWISDGVIWIDGNGFWSYILASTARITGNWAGLLLSGNAGIRMQPWDLLTSTICVAPWGQLTPWVESIKLSHLALNKLWPLRLKPDVWSNLKVWHWAVCTIDHPSCRGTSWQQAAEKKLVTTQQKLTLLAFAHQPVSIFHFPSAILFCSKFNVGNKKSNCAKIWLANLKLNMVGDLSLHRQRLI